MKIVQISSGVLTVPPPGYGGLEMVVYDLSAALQKKGHQVYIVAPTGSVMPAGVHHIDCGPCNVNAREWESQAMQKYSQLVGSEEFKDAIWHDHTWVKGMYLIKMQKPDLLLVSTLHGMLPYGSPPPVKKPCLIGISKHHADSISAGLGIPVRYAYNGIDLDRYSMNGAKRNGRYLFLARITPFKGAHTFVDLMNQLGEEGDLVGDDTLVEDKGYVERVMLACGSSGSKVRYHGGVPRDMAVEYFRKSKCYILPCNPGWNEPFGLTVVESQACGCPVIATDSGAIPELIDSQKTGIVVKSLQDLASAVRSGIIEKIDPKDCRTQAEKFSREAMADRYLELYMEAQNGGW